MTCLSCRAASIRAMCDACLRTLRPAPERVAGTVLVRSAFEHEGAARALVHRLKYEAVWGVAARLARAMEGLLGPDAVGLVPVPRVGSRRLRYGVDPALALATALGRRTGLPVTAVLRPMWWAARRAGPSGRDRGIQSFRAVGTATPGSVLIDDVVTTGTTLRAAAASTGLTRAVTATAGHSTLTLPGSVP